MDDLISRQAAIDALDVLCQEHRYKIPGKFETYSQYNEAWQDALDRAEGAIGNLPTVHPEPPKMGKWVEDVAYYDEDGCPCIITRCNQCGEPNPVSKFCPNCGARMEGNNGND